MLKNSKLLLVVTAVLELTLGIALWIAPSRVAEILLGAGLGSPESIVVARVAGAAIVSIGLTCWLSRDGGGPRTGLVMGLLTYNVSIPVLLANAALVEGMHGVALWPAIILHSVLAIWCIASLRSKDQKGGQQSSEGRD
jgi:hypothetical protein